MGPVTGFRIANLRIPGKVAYPDVTVRLADGEHTVIGLENGGGKSTLLAFLIHVLLPAAIMFLPRRAQRRQKKQGQEKLIEHYIPGGEPTHAVLEFELPVTGLVSRYAPRTVLVGACMYKSAGAPASTKIEEFFWSARCVSSQLSLTDLPIRNQAGRLLDHREWRERLAALREAHPDAEINVFDHQNKWEEHLTANLKIDIGFVKSWLLSMNEDEGAADHVFTYGSAREFLNSLVGAIGPADVIENIKKDLATRAADADEMRVDRRRADLLGALVAQTELLAASAAELRTLEERRNTLVDCTLAARLRLSAAEKNATVRAETAHGRESVAEEEARTASSLALDAAAREAQGRLQLEQLREAETAAKLDEARITEIEHTTRVQSLKTTAVLAEIRGARARIKDIERLLAATNADAEPARLAASSAAQAWLGRVTADLEDLNTQISREGERATAAATKDTEATDERLAAARSIATAEAQLLALGAQLDDLDARLARAVSAGDLEAAQDPAELARTLHREAENLTGEAGGAQGRADSCTATLASLGRAARKLEGEIAQAEALAHTLKTAWQQAESDTADLIGALIGSQLLDLPDINLSDMHEMIGESLAAVIDSARTRQLDTAVQAAQARRAAQSLDTVRLLPPRPDVSALCETALSAPAHLSARSGWAYLAQMHPDTAAAFAHAHPHLADGIIVNAPQDLQGVIDLVAQHADTLTGPVAIALPAAFQSDATPPTVSVVLPHSAYWSREAGESLVARYLREDEAHQETLARQATRQESATRLREELTRWRQAVGPTGVADAARRHTAAETAAEALRLGRATIIAQEDAATAEHSAAVALHGQLTAAAHAAQARAQRLTDLGRELSARAGIRTHISQSSGHLAAATTAEKQAAAAQESARSEIKLAGERQVELAASIGELRTAHSQAAALCSTLVTDTDPIDPADQGHDRATLARIAGSRHAHWSGATDAPHLHAELDQFREQLQAYEAKISSTGADERADAQRLLETHPNRTAADFERDALEAERAKTAVVRETGRLESDLRTLKERVEQIAGEYKSLRRTIILAPDETATDIPAAETVAARLQQARTDAAAERQRHAEALERAKTTAADADERCTLLHATIRDLSTAAAPLLVQGPLTDAIDLTDREFDLPEDVDLPRDAPHHLRALTDSLAYESPLDALRASVTAALDQLGAEIDSATRARGIAERRTSTQLQHVEATLRDASEEIVAGDQLLHMLRRLPSAQLLSQAAKHHHDASNRHIAIAHHVLKFDERVQTTASTAAASINHLLRSARRTETDSLLPGTPAMGAWSGLPLLKLTGLDTLTRDQRQQAILSTLQDWFDPDRAERRPAFDADETIWTLLQAVTPRFTAKVLIPSHPLDPTHKPVERLAVETSGGEGVTVALILASLLAARRARDAGHKRTTLFLDNPFAKVTKPAFLRLARDVANSLGVQLIALTGIKDAGALTVFPALIELRVSHRQSANVVVPKDLDDERLQDLLREGTLFISATERDAADADDDDQLAWPVISSAQVRYADQMTLDILTDPDSPQGGPGGDA